MITQDLLTYIKGELAKGTSKDVIQSNLVSGGWDAKDVAEGFSAIVPPNSIPTSAPININVQTPIQPIQPVQPIQTPAQPISLHIPEMQTPVQPIVQPVLPTQNVQASTSFQSAVTKIMPTQSSVQSVAPKITPVINYHIDVNQKKSGSPLGIIILILLVLGGGAYAYYKYFSANTVQTQTGQNATTTQSASTIDNTSQVSSTSSSASSSVNDITGVYKNTKFGYQITLDVKWHIPVDMNKVSDLLYVFSSSTTKEEFSNEYNQWTPYMATGVIISDASPAEETTYYAKASKDNQLYQFPGNLINIFATHSAGSVKDVAATSTPSISISKIIVNNKYNGEITTHPGKSMVFIQVDLMSNAKLTDGTVANRLVFSSTQVSVADLLKIVNTLVY